jgi:hypothetical protein
MKFSVGDKVKFLNEKGGGIIAKIDDKGIIHVRDEDGFDVPMSPGEIVLSEAGNKKSDDNGHRKPSTDPVNKDKPIKIQEVDTKREKVVCLGFRPRQQSRVSNSDIEMHVINDSGFHLLYTIHYYELDTYNFLKMDMLEPDTKVQVKVLNQSDLTKWSEIRIQVLFTGKGSYEPVSPVDYTMHTSRTRFYTEHIFQENEYFDDKALIVPITPNSSVYEDIIKDQDALKTIIAEKEARQHDKILKSPKPPNDILEVDLHIHELVDDYNALSNSEMVNIQLDTFHKELLNAVNSRKSSKIVFIHGVGNGTLKHELRKELESNYKSFKFQDASFKEYGYGATLVYLK